MLFTDQLFVTTSDLLAQESEVQDVADAQGITLTTTITQATQEVAEKFLALGGRLNGRTQPTFMPVDYGVQSLYTESGVRPRYALSQIVVTDADYPLISTAAKQYAVAHTLTAFYRNAARKQRSEDRYAEARDEWQVEARHALVRLRKAGMPIVGRPMPRPAADFEQNSGTWGSANVTQSAGGTLAATASFDVAITYFDSTFAGLQDDPAFNGYQANNESAPSNTVTVNVTAGNQLTVNISTLNPPAGQYRLASLARLAVNPLNADRWNIYAGPTNGVLTLQTPNGLPIGQHTATIDCGALSAAARPLANGQAADLYLEIPELISRG